MCCRVEWMELGRAALEDALPRSAHKPLGLPLMGNAVGQGWTDAEAQQFEEGMLLLGRDFPAIRKQFLPQRETEHLVLYYYNVWKTQSTPRAQAWYQRLAEVSTLLWLFVTTSGVATPSVLQVNEHNLLVRDTPLFYACSASCSCYMSINPSGMLLLLANHKISWMQAMMLCMPLQYLPQLP